MEINLVLCHRKRKLSWLRSEKKVGVVKLIVGAYSFATNCLNLVEGWFVSIWTLYAWVLVFS